MGFLLDQNSDISGWSEKKPSIYLFVHLVRKTKIVELYLDSNPDISVHLSRAPVTFFFTVYGEQGITMWATFSKTNKRISPSLGGWGAVVPIFLAGNVIFF